MHCLYCLLSCSSWPRIPERKEYTEYADQDCYNRRPENRRPSIDTFCRYSVGVLSGLHLAYRLKPCPHYVHTVAEKCDCRRKRRDNGDSRRIRQQSHFSATVWTGLKSDSSTAEVHFADFLRPICFSLLLTNSFIVCFNAPLFLSCICKWYATDRCYCYCSSLLEWGNTVAIKRYTIKRMNEWITRKYRTL